MVAKERGQVTYSVPRSLYRYCVGLNKERGQVTYSVPRSLYRYCVGLNKERGQAEGCLRRQDLEGATARAGRKPPFLAVKRPARPYKSPIQNRFT